MSLSAGARPKRKSKKVLDPDFQYEFPSSALLPDDLNLEEQSNPETYNQSTKQSTQSSKLKSAAVLAAFSSPIAIFSSSALSFDQQLQLLKLQKDKLELELKVLIISHQERPPDNTLADPSLQNALETTKPPRNKFNIDWPQDFVPSIQGEYDKIELPEFVSGFSIMIKSYDTASKDAMLAHLELLTIKGIRYSWVSVRAFHKFIVKQVEQRRLDWKDFKSIQEQATSFFRHSDLRTSRQRTAEGARLSSNTASSGNHSQAVTPSVLKACRLLISSLMVGLSITPHLHFLLHQYIIIHVLRTLIFMCKPYTGHREPTLLFVNCKWKLNTRENRTCFDLFLNLLWCEVKWKLFYDAKTMFKSTL